MPGHKGFVRCDKEGFADKIHITPANVSQSPRFGTMIKGSKAQRVLADKACAGTANRAVLKRKHRDGISHKAVRGRPLRPAQKRIHKLIGKQPFRVEGCFGTVKRKFGLHRHNTSGLPKPTRRWSWPPSRRPHSRPQTRSP